MMTREEVCIFTLFLQSTNLNDMPPRENLTNSTQNYHAEFKHKNWIVEVFHVDHNFSPPLHSSINTNVVFNEIKIVAIIQSLKSSMRNL